MMRSLAALAFAASGSLLPALVLPDVATAAPPRTCAGLTVTIDLRDADAPNPNRPESDVVLGTRRGDAIATGAGADVVCAARGNDWVIGGPGDDIIIGGPGSDGADYNSAPGPVTIDLRITGPQPTGFGTDTLRDIENLFGAEDFPSQLLGNARSNDLSGGVAADDIRGNGGADEISAGLGAQADDQLRGGTGDDEIFGGNGDDLLVGGPGDDYLCGAANLDILYGGPGDDVLYGCKGVVGEREKLFGGPGNDMLQANESDEVLSGGDGFDVVRFLNFQQAPGPGLTVDLALTGFQDTTYSGSDMLTDVEGLSGTSGADVLRGDDHANYLSGGAGADTIDGRGGTDRCVNDPADSYTSCEQLVDPPVEPR